jgi:uncharacterized protein (DUF362 family)
MWKQSRRDFLVTSAAGALALPAGMALGGSAGKLPEMAIARWTGGAKLTTAQTDEAAEKMTERAIEALGGMKRFVKRGDVVWVKPNIGWDRKPETAANTNPQIVAALIRLALEAGAKTVKMGDNPVHPAGKTYDTSGIAAAAKAAGAEVVYLDRSRFRKANIRGEIVREIPVYPEIMDCDVVINAPLIKHHVLSTLTMCMKNYLGVVENRGVFHQNLPVCIADITRYMQTQTRLHLLDGVRVLTGHGPTGGNLSDVRVKMTLAAGIDPVALDAWGAELTGRQPSQIGSVVHGQKVGLGKLDYRSLALREIAVS